MRPFADSLVRHDVGNKTVQHFSHAGSQHVEHGDFRPAQTWRSATRGVGVHQSAVSMSMNSGLVLVVADLCEEPLAIADEFDRRVAAPAYEHISAIAHRLLRVRDRSSHTLPFRLDGRGTG